MTDAKAKKEQYLERLSRWRDEKKKPLTEIKHNTTTQRDRKEPKKPTVGRVKAKPVSADSTQKGKFSCGKPTLPAHRESVRDRKEPKKPTVGRVKAKPVSADSTQKGKFSCGKPTLPVHRESVSARYQKRRAPPDTAADELMSEKLKRWKNEKGKGSRESTIPPTAGLEKPRRPGSSPKVKLVKEVRSRLLDYLNKPKENVARKCDSTKQIVGIKDTVPTNKALSVVIKQKKGPKVVSLKTGLKRRHSDGHALVSDYKQPKGILKRKSCIGSISDDTNTDSHCDRIETDKDTSDEVFPTLPSEGTRSVPIAVVTPGYSTRSVTFVSPAETGSTDGPRLRKTPLPNRTPPASDSKTRTASTLKRDLNKWLEEKGRTPSKFRHMMCFHDQENMEEKPIDPQTKTNLSVKELSEQMDVIQLEEQNKENQQRLKVMLDECMTLFDAGCPAEAIVPWLEDIFCKIPSAQTAAQFYMCKAKVVKSQLDLDALLAVFQTAMINDAQPKADVASCLTEAIRYVNEEQLRKARQRSRTPRRRPLDQDNVFQSSTVKYAMSTATPLSECKKSRKERKSSISDGCQVVTPVRRSTRRSLQNLPESLRDKRDMYTSLADMDEEKMLFQPNMALDALLAQADDDHDDD